MSAITGIFYRDGRLVSRKEINGMNDHLSHRGPDGSEIWLDGSIALGHQMMHTTSESLQEELPFKDADSGLVVTADARIDNRVELAPLLGIEDVDSVSDSLFILKAYQKWGGRCLERLLGDFAFAIWDPVKEQMFCARDHIGVKPFYYYLSGELFLFATEIKALFAIQDVRYELNEIKVAFHLINIDDNQSTFFNNIYRLKAAHSITIDLNEHKINKYWELNRESQIEMDSEEDYVKAFLEIFTEAVKCRLRSAVPLGFELSGGLDSSSVACVGNKILRNYSNPNQDEIKTFSILYNDFQDADERYFIKKVIDTGGFNPHSLYADNISPMENIKTILEIEDGPFNIRTLSVIWKFNKMIHDNNVRVVLTGEDGDSVISKGQNYFRELAVTFRWKTLINELNASSSIFSENKRLFNESNSVYIKNSYNRSFYNLLLKKVIFPLIPDFLRNILKPIYNRKNHVRMKPDLFSLNKKFIKRLNLNEHLNELYIVPNKKIKTPKEFHYNIFKTRPHQMALEMIDNLAANLSIEKRHPFYDKRLIEFCYAIPDEMKFHLGWDRYILRIAMGDILPEEVRWRFLKQDFNPPLQRNLLLFEKNLLEEMIYDGGIISDYVDLTRLNAIYNNYKAQNGGTGIADSVNGVTDSFDTWLISILYVWLHENKNIKVQTY